LLPSSCFISFSILTSFSYHFIFISIFFLWLVFYFPVSRSLCASLFARVSLRQSLCVRCFARVALRESLFFCASHFARAFLRKSLEMRGRREKKNNRKKRGEDKAKVKAEVFGSWRFRKPRFLRSEGIKAEIFKSGRGWRQMRMEGDENGGRWEWRQMRMEADENGGGREWRQMRMEADENGGGWEWRRLVGKLGLSFPTNFSSVTLTALQVIWQSAAWDREDLSWSGSGRDRRAREHDDTNNSQAVLFSFVTFLRLAFGVFRVSSCKRIWENEFMSRQIAFLSF